ncbi:MAG TPA: DNA polymerase I [Capsulimonadaceae bacterium]|nr:DNA polymerase I [Capsulimonadaceae bacterium]
MARILLLDGNSLLYRGFFAMRMLSTSYNQPTNAIYSLTLMLLAALDREKPDAVVCVFDAPVQTFRHAELDSYKGQRQAPPDELSSQKPLARELMAAFRIPILEVEGVEADDTIGTLAEAGKRGGHEVLIVTADLDALQLIDDDHGPVKIMTTVKGVTETVIYDSKAVFERYGLAPAQIPDFKALKGDASDNLPGVPGIGEKTARKLLEDYGSLENLLANIDQLPEKQRVLLAAHQDAALQYKRLATIVRDVPLPPDFEFTFDYQTVGPDWPAVRDLFDRLEFRTLLRRVEALVPDLTPLPPSPRGQGEPTIPRSFREQGGMEDNAPRSTSSGVVEGLGECASFLIATTPAIEKADLMSAVPNALAVSRGDEATCRPWDEIGEAERAFLADADRPKTTFDTKLMTGILARHGMALAGVRFDILLAAYLINAGRSNYKLTDLIADYTGQQVAEADFAGQARALRFMEPVLQRRLEEDHLIALHDEIELPLAPILARMEMTGVTIDSAWLTRLSREMQVQMQALEGDIFALAGESFAIGSTKQLQVVLFEKMALPAGKKTKTGYSTDAEVMEGLAAQGFEIATKVLQWRELSKLKSTYADALPALVNPSDGKVHTSLNQTVASTGRLSSSNPNLQNIPIRSAIGREIRKAFVADPPCVLVSADYSQIELRIFAHITQDPELIRTFEAGEDIHVRTAALVFASEEVAVSADQRRRAKTINFAVIYGMTDFRLATELGVDLATASEWKKTYFARYPGVRLYAERVLSEARERGYVSTLLGRRRYAPDINSRVFAFRQAAEREAINMPIQGTSADIIKLAMIRIDQALKERSLKAKMVLQVHDELLFECPPDEVPALAALVRDCMENACPLSVHLKVEVRQGQNWSEMVSVE